MCGHSPLHHITHHSRPEPAQKDVGHIEHPVVTKPCPSCGVSVQEDFVFCPNCGAEILAACPSCHRAVQTDWMRCPYCGVDLLEQSAKTVS